MPTMAGTSNRGVARAGSLCLFVMSLVALGWPAMGCGRTREPRGAFNPQSPPIPDYPVVDAPLRAAGWSSMFGVLGAEIPCPLPGTPPEVARLMDCSAMKKVLGATKFAPRQIVAASLPPSVDHRQWGLSGPVKAQEQVGACSGFAVSSVMDNTARRARRGEVVSPLHVFATYTGHGLDVLKGRPMTLENIWPYDPARACRFSKADYQSGSCGDSYHVVPGSAWTDPALMGEHARAESSGALRIDAFEEISEPIDFDQIAALLADGESIWASIRFYRPAWQSDELEETGYIPDYPPESTTESHAVTLEGYRWGRWGREFLLKNSWGTDWGKDGRAWMPEVLLKKHFTWGYRIRSSLTNIPSNGSPAEAPTRPDALCIPGFFCLPGANTSGSPQQAPPLPFPSNFPIPFPRPF